MMPKVSVLCSSMETWNAGLFGPGVIFEISQNPKEVYA